jgi:hypothetical protein
VAPREGGQPSKVGRESLSASVNPLSLPGGSSMLNPLLPQRADNTYHGHKLALWLFALGASPVRTKHSPTGTTISQRSGAFRDTL